MSKPMSEHDIVERFREQSYRDDCLDSMVPSDIRELLGEITRLRAQVELMKRQGFQYADKDPVAAEREAWKTENDRLRNILVNISNLSVPGWDTTPHDTRYLRLVDCARDAIRERATGKPDV